MQLEHKDIKPANILFKEMLTPESKLSDIHVKIADFGLAKFSDTTTAMPQRKSEGCKNCRFHFRYMCVANCDLTFVVFIVGKPTLPSTYAGTLEYMPPEALRSEEKKFVRFKLKEYLTNLPPGRRRNFVAALLAQPSPRAQHPSKETRTSLMPGQNGNTKEMKEKTLSRSSTFSSGSLSLAIQNLESKNSIMNLLDTESSETGSWPPAWPLAGLVPFKWDSFSFGSLLWQVSGSSYAGIKTSCAMTI